jgi:dsDNA-binding SOS-regulon protein
MQINPLYTDVKLLRTEAKEYDEALKIAEELEQLRTELTRTLENFSDADLARLDHFLPRNLDTVRIILDVDGIAKANNVKLENLDIDEPTQTPTGQGNVPGHPSVSSIAVGFGFTATYQQAIQFIQKLEKSLRLFETTSLMISPTANSTGLYDFDMTIDTYWINR